MWIIYYKKMWSWTLMMLLGSNDYFTIVWARQKRHYKLCEWQWETSIDNSIIALHNILSLSNDSCGLLV